MTDSRRAETASSVGLPTSTIHDAPVLVIEDDHDLREIIADVLRDHDISVSVAANGQQALDHLVTGGVQPSVILLDMMMPVMDGWRFREAMLGHPSLATIPIVVMTAHADPKRVASEIGAVGSLAKPINVVDLLQAATSGAAHARKTHKPPRGEDHQGTVTCLTTRD